MLEDRIIYIEEQHSSFVADFLRAAKYSTDLSMYECRGGGEKTEKS